MNKYEDRQYQGKRLREIREGIGEINRREYVKEYMKDYNKRDYVKKKNRKANMIYQKALRILRRNHKKEFSEILEREKRGSEIPCVK